MLQFLRHATRSAVALMSCAFMAGCSASVVTDGGADASVDQSLSDGLVDTGSSDTGTMTDTGGDSGSVQCPASLPTAGSTCPRAGLVCQYGTDPRENCRPSATCTAGVWQVSSPTTCTPISPPAMCPATREAASGQSCTTMDAACNYSGLVCVCTNCRSFPVGGCFGPLAWRCTAPNPVMECPIAQPNLGTPCAMAGQFCSYDCNEYGINGSRRCTDGVWESASSPCPVSSRLAKEDIRYLSDSEAMSLAHDALRTRLATYEYKDPALRGRRRLGFIYEDSTTHNFARDPEISGVDLYGYTSLLLVTVQQQQREIEALRHDLEALRTQSARPVASSRRRP